MVESFPRKNPLLVVTGVVASVLLSLWAMYADGIINNDGVHYILTAEYIAAGDWGEALQVFKWPAYSYLIYLFQLLPGLDYEAAAHAVTTVGFTLAVLGFVNTVHALGGRGRILWLALITILVYPGFNEFRSFLIRDALFLSLYLFSLAALFRYLASRRKIEMALAIVYMSVAALFRVEALTFCALLPAFVMFSRPNRGAVVIGTVVYLLAVLPLLALFYGWWVYRPEDGNGIWATLGEPYRFLAGVFEQLSDEFRERLDASGAAGGAGLASAFFRALWLLFRESVEAVTVPFFAIICYELAKRRFGKDWPKAATRLLVWLLALNALILFIFAFAKSFLAPRYPVALAVTLILAIPFALERYAAYFSRSRGSARRYPGLGIVILLVAVNLVEGLDSFSEKYYLRESALWLNEHARPGYRLTSNDPKFVYYSGHYAEKEATITDEEEFREFLAAHRWKYRDYVAVNVRHREPGFGDFVVESLEQEPIARFASKNGDELLLFYTGDE